MRVVCAFLLPSSDCIRLLATAPSVTAAVARATHSASWRLGLAAPCHAHRLRVPFTVFRLHTFARDKSHCHRGRGTCDPLCQLVSRNGQIRFATLLAGESNLPPPPNAHRFGTQPMRIVCTLFVLSSDCIYVSDPRNLTPPPRATVGGAHFELSSL